MSSELLQLRCSNGSTQVGMRAVGLLLCQAGPDWADPDRADLRRLRQNRADLQYFFHFFFLKAGRNLNIHAAPEAGTSSRTPLCLKRVYTYS